MHLIFRFAGGQQIPVARTLPKVTFRPSRVALILRGSQGIRQQWFYRKAVSLLSLQFFQQLAVPHQIQRFIAGDLVSSSDVRGVAKRRVISTCTLLLSVSAPARREYYMPPA